MIHFAWPFAALIFFLPFVAHHFINETHEKLLTIQTRTLAYTSFLKDDNSRSIKFNKILLVVCWFLFIFCLCKPQVLSKEELNRITHQQTIVAIDVSKSMEIKDFTFNGSLISRLDITKNALKHFLLPRSFEDIALVTFGDFAYVYTPFSNKTDQINETIEELSPGLLGNFTAMNDALALSLKMFDSDENINKTLILMSDGRDTTERLPIATLEPLLEKSKVKIFTIGLGSPDEDSQSSLDEFTLKKISLITNGSYFHAQSESDLKQIFDEIEKQTPNNSTVEINPVYIDVYWYPLCLLLLCLNILWIRIRHV